MMDGDEPRAAEQPPVAAEDASSLVRRGEAANGNEAKTAASERKGEGRESPPLAAAAAITKDRESAAEPNDASKGRTSSMS